MSLTINQTIERVDWDLLFNQKLTLLEVIDAIKIKDPDNKRVLEGLDGLIELLDNLGDAAENECLWTNPYSE